MNELDLQEIEKYIADSSTFETRMSAKTRVYLLRLIEEVRTLRKLVIDRGNNE